jgi:transposase-like protein
MRYPASEKLEIIRTVEASHLPTRQTLKMLGIPSSTYYDWYARWSDGGIDALADLDLSRFSAAPGAHLSGLSFKSQRAFPA